MKCHKAIVDLITEIATQTVKQLRQRARLLRDAHSLRERFRGLWSLRKQALVRVVAETELELLDNQPSAIEECETMFYKSIESQVAASIVRGAARGAKALGSESLEEFQEQIGQIQTDVENGKDVFDEQNGITYNGSESPVSDDKAKTANESSKAANGSETKPSAAKKTSSKK